MSADDDWFFVRDRERHGPVPLATLRQLAKTGRLTPEDLVWHESLPAWTPAGQVPGIHGGALAQMLPSAIPGVKTPPLAGQPPAGQSPARNRRPVTARVTDRIDHDSLTLRHLLAGCGGFLAVLGITFTAIAQSRVALAFTLSGLVIATLGLHVEIGRLLGQAVANIGKASQESADRRLRAMQLTLEKQRLDIEAIRLAQEQAVRDAPPVAPALTGNEQQAESVPTGPGGGNLRTEGRTTVVRE